MGSFTLHAATTLGHTFLKGFFHQRKKAQPFSQAPTTMHPSPSLVKNPFILYRGWGGRFYGKSAIRRLTVIDEWLRKIQ